MTNNEAQPEAMKDRMKAQMITSGKSPMLSGRDVERLIKKALDDENRVLGFAQKPADSCQ